MLIRLIFQEDLRLPEVRQRIYSWKRQKILLKTNGGYTSDINGKVRDDARFTEYSVTFVNNSDKTAALELLSSFAF